MKKLIAILSVLLLMGCTTTRYVYVPQVEVRTDTIIHNNTLIQKDTIYQSEKIVTINDTVYITKYKYVGKESSNVKTDTVIRTDSIPYPVEVPVEVEVVKYRTPGWCYLLITLIAVGVAAFIHRKLKGVRDALR